MSTFMPERDDLLDGTFRVLVRDPPRPAPADFTGDTDWLYIVAARESPEAGEIFVNHSEYGPKW